MVASMIVPTGRSFFATSTFGPVGTPGAAACACCAPAPVNMFLAMTAVMAATTNAPTRSNTFLKSMARTPPLQTRCEQPYKSGKLVKKPLGENRERTDCDRDAVRHLRPALPRSGPMHEQSDD